MSKRYKVLLKYSGSASLEIEADSVDAVRRRIAELELADIARVGHANILSFELAIREITPTVIGVDEEEGESSGRPRPSGWYRPA